MEIQQRRKIHRISIGIRTLPYNMTHTDSAGEPLSGDGQSGKGRDSRRRWLGIAEPINQADQIDRNGA
jgi:hypothetical protein